MRTLKLLAVAVGLASFAMPGSAWATELYKGSPGTTLKVGDTIFVSLEPGTTLALTDTGGNPINTCTTSTIDGKVTDAGGSGKPVKSAMEALTWGGATDPCTQATSTLTLGQLAYDYTRSHNATVTGSNILWQVTVFGVNCRYGTGAGTTLGTLTGKTGAAEHATWDLNGVLPEQEPKSFLCPDTSRLTGSYIVTTPTGLHVRDS